MSNVILPFHQQILLFALSWVIVAFGQPVASNYLSIISALCGYALFWRILIDYSSWKKRFIVAAGWFTLVQFVQLSWFISHPYYYIYIVYFALSLALGLQFGIIGILIDRAHLTRIRSLAAIAGLWTIFEWARLFFLSGFSWNPVGLAFSGNNYSLQAASLAGVFGLSFWVILVNLLALRAWLSLPSIKSVYVWSAAAAVPFLFGFIQLTVHNTASQSEIKPFNVVLVQTAFPVEEELGIKDKKAMVAFVIKEWRQILSIIKKQWQKPIDLIVLPEFVVPYGTYSFVYPYEVVKEAFIEVFGESSLEALPPLQLPVAMEFNNPNGTYYLVNNAYWTQAIANHFNTGLLVGLEDAERTAPDTLELYSAALYFRPMHQLADGILKPVGRYEKRVLVPMGEYIPFAFCRTLAAAYGIQGSFTCGKNAKIFYAGDVPFGVSICYEETFGNIVRENKQIGAAILANLTNDAWYPNSTLTQQHCDHARLRTVECGIPLIRACNTGVTGAIDSFGRDIAMLGSDSRQAEWVADSLHVAVPMYHFSTLYSLFGDSLIVGISCLLCLGFLRFSCK